MIDLLGTLLGVAEKPLWQFAQVFLRVGAMMAVLPAFGEQVVPNRIKLVAALSFSLIASPVIWAADTITQQAPVWNIALFAEVIIGLILGLLFRFFVFALQIAGSIASNVTSLTQLFGAGLGSDPQPAFATLFVVAGLALATLLGLHLKVLEALVLSYDLFPAGRFPAPSDLSDWGVSKVGSTFALGLTLAGPFVIAAIIYNLGLGVINRAMPQLMVAFVGAPAISFGGLVLLLVTAPFLLSVWINLFTLGTDLNGGAFR